MENSKLIVALDVPEKKQALEIIETLEGIVDFFKIGLELGIRIDDALIKSLTKRGKRIFLDYKFHDIGNTVESAVKNAAELGVYMLTVHAEKQVLEAAVKGASGTKTKVFGVTVLTSLEQDYADQYGCSLKDLVLRRAEWVNNSGANGVILSPQEASLIRTQFPKLEICTPGIRPHGSSRNDQARTASPADAIRAGANYLVIGRPITQSKNPVQAAKDIIEEIKI